MKSSFSAFSLKRVATTAALTFLTCLTAHAASLVNFDLTLNTAIDGGASYTSYTAGGSGSQTRFVIGFQITINTIDGTSVNPGTIAAFCSEIAEPISTLNYTFTSTKLSGLAAGQAGVGTSASSNIPEGGIGALRAARVSYLFDQYYISDQLSAWTQTAAQPTLHAFQMALWELTHDTDLSISASSGAVYVNAQTGGGSSLRNNARSLAQAMIDEVNSADIDESYISQKFHIYALVDTNGAGATGFQDVVLAISKSGPVADELVPLITVPEPGSAALILFAAGFLCCRRSRRN